MGFNPIQGWCTSLSGKIGCELRAFHIEFEASNRILATIKYFFQTGVFAKLDSQSPAFIPFMADSLKQPPIIACSSQPILPDSNGSEPL